LAHEAAISAARLCGEAREVHTKQVPELTYRGKKKTGSRNKPTVVQTKKENPEQKGLISTRELKALPEGGGKREAAYNATRGEKNCPRNYVYSSNYGEGRVANDCEQDISARRRGAVTAVLTPDVKEGK